MSNHADEQAMARLVADGLWALVQMHEMNCADDECRFREGIIAYLAHVIGLRHGPHGGRIRELMYDYELSCPHELGDPNCDHGNGAGP